jgi:hypothetical protein
MNPESATNEQGLAIWWHSLFLLFKFITEVQ